MSWNPTGVFDHARHVQQIPRHESGVAISEIVFRPAGPRVEVRSAGACFTEPSHAPMVTRAFWAKGELAGMRLAVTSCR